MSLANYCTPLPLPIPSPAPTHTRTHPRAGALNSASGAEVTLSSRPRGASDSPRLVNFLVSHWPERPVASISLSGKKRKYIVIIV